MMRPIYGQDQESVQGSKKKNQDKAKRQFSCSAEVFFGRQSFPSSSQSVGWHWILKCGFLGVLLLRVFMLSIFKNSSSTASPWTGSSLFIPTLNPQHAGSSLAG